MPGRPNSRNWNDVQTAIATAAIVTTLGLWNLFATPSKSEVTQTQEPVVPPTEPPVAAAVPTLLPQVKIMFTPVAPQATAVQQTQSNNKKRKNKNTNNTSSSGSVTQTKTS